jgi:Phage capsid family
MTTSNRALVPADRDLQQRFEQNVAARDFLRYGLAMAIVGGNRMNAIELCARRWPSSSNFMHLKSAVQPGGTGSGNWAAQWAQVTTWGASFLELVRPLTVIGRMTGFRRPPFNVRFPRQTGGVEVAWTAEGGPTPASSMSFELVTHKQYKAGAIVAISEELARNEADPAAEGLIRRDLTDQIVQFLDESFLDPTLAGADNVSPASITYGATAINSTGNTAAQVEADFLSLFAAVTTNLRNPYLVMRSSTAKALVALRTTSGDRLFPDLGVVGGQIWGVPVLISDAIPLDGLSPSGGRVVLIDANQINLTEGGIEFDSSSQTSLRLTDQQSISPELSTDIVVSLFQQNNLALRVIRYANWSRAQDSAVAYIDGVEF